MKTTKIITFLCVLLLAITSCGTPKSFVKSASGGDWSSIQIRDGLEYDKAFSEVLDVVAKRFEMEMISKDGGYGRTQWVYTWNEKRKYTPKYRTRVIFKFSPDKTKVDIKTEAEYGGDDKWKKGYDTRLLETIKQDIMGVVGRTTL